MIKKISFFTVILFFSWIINIEAKEITINYQFEGKTIYSENLDALDEIITIKYNDSNYYANPQDINISNYTTINISLHRYKKIKIITENNFEFEQIATYQDDKIVLPIILNDFDIISAANNNGILEINAKEKKKLYYINEKNQFIEDTKIPDGYLFAGEDYILLNGEITKIYKLNSEFHPVTIYFKENGLNVETFISKFKNNSRLNLLSLIPDNYTVNQDIENIIVDKNIVMEIEVKKTNYRLSEEKNNDINIYTSSNINLKSNSKIDLDTNQLLLPSVFLSISTIIILFIFVSKILKNNIKK